MTARGRAGPRPAFRMTQKGSAAMQRSVTSVIAGKAASGAPGGTLSSVNPADLSEVVAEVALGDAGRSPPLPGRAGGPAGLGRGARAGARPGHRAHRPPGRGQQRGAGPAGHPGDRQADRRGPRRGAGDHRHLRLLPRRGPAAVRPDRAERDAGQAAVHLPGPGRRGGVITAGNFPVAVPSWYLVPALLCGNAVVWKPAEYAAACGAARSS